MTEAEAEVIAAARNFIYRYADTHTVYVAARQRLSLAVAAEVAEKEGPAFETPASVFIQSDLKPTAPDDGAPRLEL